MNGRSFEGSWFSFVHPSEASGILDSSRSPFKTSEEAQFDIELTGTICPWTGRLEKKKKKQKFAVHIPYNGTSQASRAFSCEVRLPCLFGVFRSLYWCALWSFLALSLLASTYLLYPYTTRDAVSDWGRTVVPKNVARSLNLWSNSHIKSTL